MKLAWQPWMKKCDFHVPQEAGSIDWRSVLWVYIQHLELNLDIIRKVSISTTKYFGWTLIDEKLTLLS
ncbi:unnamed protein product [Calypogeia fissa]